MASRIFRYPIPEGVRDFFLSIPAGGRILKLVVKDGSPQLYFLVPDPKAETREHLFFVVPTGVEFRPEEEEAMYMDSFIIPTPGESLVFHLLIEAASARPPQ